MKKAKEANEKWSEKECGQTEVSKTGSWMKEYKNEESDWVT